MKVVYNGFRKGSLMAVILLIGTCMSALPDFFLAIGSYNGGYYYPGQTDNEFSYTDKQDIRFGIKYLTESGINTHIGLLWQDRLLDGILQIDTLSIAYRNNYGAEAGFIIGNIGYGRRSDIIDKDIMSSYYLKPTVVDYDFRGVYGDIPLAENLSFSSYIGGNKLNSAVVNTKMEMRNGANRISLFHLYTGKDDQFARSMHSVGNELDLGYGRFRVSNTSWAKLPGGNENRVYLKNYSELLINIIQNIDIGGTVLYSKKHRGYKNWVEKSLLLRKQSALFEALIYYNKVETGSLQTSSIKPILLVRVNDKLLMGINSGVYYSDFEDRYYSLGIQVRYYEKFSL